jgi:asparagine synthase (glutamine-hydrolysing)
MCGICGIIDYSGKWPVDEETLNRMVATLAHRGPDDRGVKIFGNGEKPRVGLGHSRLGVIDPSSRGHQPMSNEDDSIWLLYNGEVYNFPSLRPELEAKGHRFRSYTDAEVVLHAYEQYGEKCLELFRGDFAFAIWDGRKRKLFLARDRVGVKPLYYYHHGGCFIFASEPKAILACPGVVRSVDPRGLSDFLTYEFIPFPNTLLKEIKKPPPAASLTLEDGRLRTTPYWEVRYDIIPRGEEEVCEGLVEVLRESVKMRLISDVPLGAFLSGGLDSSTVVSLMSQVAKEVKTFSIGFEDKTYNELSYAGCAAGAFGTHHREFFIQPKAVELFEKLMYHLDDPIADFSIFPTYLVSKMARDYVTVALSGDGGDETFGGYDTYIAHKIARLSGGVANLLGRWPVSQLVSSIAPSPKKKGFINRLKRFSEGLGLPRDLRHYRWMIFLSELEKEAMFTEALQDALGGYSSYEPIMQRFSRVRNADELNKLLYVDLKTYLIDDGAVKVDRMSMACSLEVRVPILDHKVIEYMASVPPALKLKGMTTKHILRRAFSNVLPDTILHRGKEGFSIPIKNWLKRELKPLMLDLLSEDTLTKRGYFKPKVVAKLIKEHLEGRENHSHRLWALMVFEQWARTFMD